MPVLEVKSAAAEKTKHQNGQHCYGLTHTHDWQGCCWWLRKKVDFAEVCLGSPEVGPILPQGQQNAVKKQIINKQDKILIELLEKGLFNII